MKLMDWGRGVYVRGPRWLRAAAGLALTLAPQAVRLGGTYRRMRAAIERSERDAAFVADFQLRQLRSLIAACGARSPYYQEVFEHAFGRIPNAERFTAADLLRLPVMTKEAIRARPERLLVTSRRLVDRGTTSGSSGEPFAFYLDRDRSAWEWAFRTHIWAKVGYRPGDRTAVLRGVLIPGVDRRPWEYDRGLRELRLSAFHLSPPVMDCFLSLVERKRIRFLLGYPSALDILARHAARQGWRAPPTLRGALPFSETLFAEQRENIQRGFSGVPVVPFYGLSEKVAFAGEVLGAPDVYEFEPLYGLTELVDEDGRPIERVGDEGRLVSTGLLLRGMPLLRYDTGDRATLVRRADASHCHRLQVSRIRARRRLEFLVAKDGALLSATAINVHSDSYLAIQVYQFRQDVPGLAKLRVVPAPGKSRTDIEPFVEEISRKVGARMEFELEIVESLPSGARGKRQLIDQRISCC